MQHEGLNKQSGLGNTTTSGFEKPVQELSLCEQVMETAHMNGVMSTNENSDCFLACTQLLECLFHIG